MSDERPNENDEWLTMRQVAELFGVGDATIRVWCKKGDFPAGDRLANVSGRPRRWRRSEVEPLLIDDREYISNHQLAEKHGVVLQTIVFWQEIGRLPPPDRRRGKTPLWLRSRLKEWNKKIQKLEADYLNVRQIAGLCGVAASTVRLWKKQGRLPPVNHSHRREYFWKRSDVETWLATREKIKFGPKSHISEWLSLRDVAALFGVRPGEIAAWRKRGIFPAGEQTGERGNALRFKRSEIEAILIPNDGSYLDAAEVAELIGISRDSVISLQSKGELPEPRRNFGNKRRSRAYVWNRKEIEAWVEDQRREDRGHTKRRRPGRPRGVALRDPTPEEIAQRCAEIQRGWKDWERMRRAYGFTPEDTKREGDPEQNWNPPMISERELHLGASSDDYDN